MKRVQLALVVTMAALLAGCALRGQPQTARNTPPAPKNVADAAPPPSVRNLSTPQTTVELPPLQKIPDGALEPPQPVQVEPAPAPQQTTGRNNRQQRPPQTTTRPETPAPVTTPQPATPAPPEPEPPRQAIQEIVPASDQKRYQEEASNTKKEIQQLLGSLRGGGRRLKAKELQTERYIESFVKQSGEAETRGDYKAAAELAQRGLALARELTVGK